MSTVWVIIVALIMLIGISLISYADEIKALIAGNNFGDGGEHGGENSLPIISDGELSDINEVFYEGTASDLFSSINVRDSYRRVFRITYSYSGVQTTDMLTMLKCGSNYSVESSSKKLIYSDGKLYIKSEMYSFIADATESEIYDDIGITSLDKIIEIASADNADVDISSDGKQITVTYIESDASSRSEYEISLESGIVTYEAHYVSGQLTRSVTTDSVEILIGEEISEEHFEIPTLQ
jgi:hypothetical protein